MSGDVDVPVGHACGGAVNPYLKKRYSEDDFNHIKPPQETAPELIVPVPIYQLSLE